VRESCERGAREKSERGEREVREIGEREVRERGAARACCLPATSLMRAHALSCSY
jgi:hypothetical protein